MTTLAGRVRLALLPSALVTVTAAAQAIRADQVPAAVQHALRAKYPAAPGVAWRLDTERNLVASFRLAGARVIVTFTPAGRWLASSTEIGAITLPVPVRTAVIAGYRGYQFTEVRRLDRAAVPARLFEVHLYQPGESLSVRFTPDGRRVGSESVAIAPPPTASLPGTWRGVSTCPRGVPACHAEPVIYRITATPDSTAFDARMSAIVDGREVDRGSFPCTLDRSRSAFYCTAVQASWRLQLRQDSLVGNQILDGEVTAAHVVLRRVP